MGNLSTATFKMPVEVDIQKSGWAEAVISWHQRQAGDNSSNLEYLLVASGRATYNWD